MGQRPAQRKASKLVQQTQNEKEFSYAQQDLADILKEKAMMANHHIKSKSWVEYKQAKLERLREHKEMVDGLAQLGGSSTDKKGDVAGKPYNICIDKCAQSLGGGFLLAPYARSKLSGKQWHLVKLFEQCAETCQARYNPPSLLDPTRLAQVESQQKKELHGDLAQVESQQKKELHGDLAQMEFGVGHLAQVKDSKPT